MELLATGLNHTTASLDIREKLHFPRESLYQALARLTDLSSVSEACVLSTCNRVEIYAACNDAAKAANDIAGFLAEFHRVPEASFKPSMLVFRGAEAVTHVFGVAAGIRSVVLGEGQILGQVRDAFFFARDNGFTSSVLNKLFNGALACGKRARAETDIGRGAVSVSQAAVELARGIFADFGRHSVMIIGAGKMGELAVKHLRAGNIGKIYVSNRSYEKAEAAAQIYGGEAVKFESLSGALEKCDIVISSTSAPGFVVTAGEAVALMKKRGGRQMFFIDLAVPRDIDPEIEKIDNVFLYTVDDLKHVIDANLERRQASLGHVEGFILEAAEDFNRWAGRLSALPVIGKLKERLLAQKEIALAHHLKAARKKGAGDGVNVELVDRVTDKVVDKIVRQVVQGFDACRSDRERAAFCESVQRMFGL